MGYGYPPRCLPHGILGNVAKHYGIWVPPPRCGQTNKVKVLPSRRTTYAGGNNLGGLNLDANFVMRTPALEITRILLDIAIL